MYYTFIQNDNIIGCGQCQVLNPDIINYEVSEEVFNAIVNDKESYIYNGDIVPNPDYEQILMDRERARKDALALTPSDVERALLKAKGWDFEDLKTFLKTKGYTDLQIKAIGVELRANNFYRGATIGEGSSAVRIVDTIGILLGYTFEDMDYLFEHKELPIKGNVDN